MITAGFVSSSPNWDWSRQFAGRNPQTGGVRFLFEGPFDACDILFVYDALPQQTLEVTTGYSVFVASEPASIKTYNPAFLRQFDAVLTTDKSTAHRNAMFMQVGLPWHAGAWDAEGKLREQAMALDEFQQFSPNKTRLVSIVSSNKAYTEGHRDRLEFVARAKQYFGDDMDVFGRGINGFADKLDVLSSYRYHIAIENSVYSDYWTEKLADPFLALTYPIYHGSPNISAYFPEGSMTSIDISDADQAIKTIARIVESDTAERALPLLEEARRRVLNEHNLFNILADVAKTSRKDYAPRSKRVLVSEKMCETPIYRLRRSLTKRYTILRRLLTGAAD